MSSIWSACDGLAHLARIGGTLWRLVESQEQIATTQIVDGLDEQAVLEEMLEQSKPQMPAAGPAHFLLRSPFRYPPLFHGSRFGGCFEPSLFYGSLSPATMLAEGAYYRFLFWFGMQTPPSSPLTSQHTAFTARYRSKRGVRLQNPPFDAFRDRLTDRVNYGETQELGAAMREAGVEAFEFVSARDPEGGLNVALFSPVALASQRPVTAERWVCQIHGHRLQFLHEASRSVHEFDVDLFLVDGRLPKAAA